MAASSAAASTGMLRRGRAADNEDGAEAAQEAGGRRIRPRQLFDLEESETEPEPEAEAEAVQQAQQAQAPIARRRARGDWTVAAPSRGGGGDGGSGGGGGGHTDDDATEDDDNDEEYADDPLLRSLKRAGLPTRMPFGRHKGVGLRVMWASEEGRCAPACLPACLPVGVAVAVS